MALLMKEIAQVVRFHRKRSGLSRIQLADIAGVGKTLIYDIEHAKETVKFFGLQKVLQALNIQMVLESPIMESYRQQEVQHENG